MRLKIAFVQWALYTEERILSRRYKQQKNHAIKGKAIKILRNILWAAVLLNLILLIAFILPPGRAYYMPRLLVSLTSVLTGCAIFGIFPISVCCAAGTLFMLIYKKLKNYPIDIYNIILLFIHLISIPLGRSVFLAAMSI